MNNLMSKYVKNLIGKKFGRLLVKSFAYVKDRRSYWQCECDCGKKKIIGGNTLQTGTTKSCGCLYKETNGINRFKHGLTKTKTYKIWLGMRNRCNNPKSPNYKDYGGRGITVCDKWSPDKGGSFENFLKDMRECPMGLSIDRKNNDLGYYKENCRWATPKQQSNNRRNTPLVFPIKNNNILWRYLNV